MLVGVWRIGVEKAPRETQLISLVGGDVGMDLEVWFADLMVDGRWSMADGVGSSCWENKETANRNLGYDPWQILDVGVHCGSEANSRMLKKVMDRRCASHCVEGDELV